MGWLSKGRHILWEQILRQISSDGTGREQSVWYLGFVLDAFFHYLLLEDREIIPKEVLERVEKALGFINEITFQDGTFFDFGDRDDGFVFRISCDYGESPFPGLLNLGTCIFEEGAGSGICLMQQTASSSGDVIRGGTYRAWQVRCQRKRQANRS